jgi:hypothetical protein
MTNYIDLPLSGLEGPLSEMEETVQDMAHRFARIIMRNRFITHWPKPMSMSEMWRWALLAPV